MKNIILGLFLFLGFIAQAQVTVASININDIEDVNYIRVQVSPRLLLNRIDVAVDYGQERGSFFGRQEVKDKEGKTAYQHAKEKGFNNLLDLLNH